MKQGPLYLLCLCVSVFTSCSFFSSTEPESIVIKGSISSSAAVKSSKLEGSAAAYTLGDATKILVFNSSGEYEIFNIKDSEFAARALQGTAVALAFLADDNTFIGSLQCAGLNVLPLVSLSDGENTVIDLSALYLEGTDVLASNSPFGSEIMLSDEEMERFRQFGSFFKSLAENMDTDRNGKADILDKKELFVSTMHYIYCGSWGINEQAALIDTTHLYINYFMRIWGGKNLTPESEELSLFGPEGSVDAETLYSGYNLAPDGFITFFQRTGNPAGQVPYQTQNPAFLNGSYVMKIDGNEFLLQYSGVDAEYFFVVAVPTIHTNESNEVVSVSLEYQDLRGEPVEPENFVYQAMVQFGGNNVSLAQTGSIWESPRAKFNTELYSFTLAEPIALSDLDNISVCYVDLVGNSYTISFNKPE